ncbi:MAG: VOC family protein [Gammaproteobacteria bacterium]|nr:VOC family protein [Gammaproteobacteria bacterium]MDH3553127.1 VOC family protein [Gammaproteobacteria bacterium]
MNLNQVTVRCIDYNESVAFYAGLGLRQIVDSPPRYARFESASGTTLSIHAVDTVAAESGTTLYFEVDDVDAEVERLKAGGLEFDSDPINQSWLWREACLHDPAGNRVCIYHAGENRRFPPWRI